MYYKRDILYKRKKITRMKSRDYVKTVMKILFRSVLSRESSLSK